MERRSGRSVVWTLGLGTGRKNGNGVVKICLRHSHTRDFPSRAELLIADSG